ncbi:hypothetical protein MYX82_01330 [Acidobacteria bacterium AH-259-D05]|nr:hypothetical protein [Acidobacteria bacterium AH-259-D05]
MPFDQFVDRVYQNHLLVGAIPDLLAAVAVSDPISPELKPIERVWGICSREITYNRYFESMENLELSLTPLFVK